ncbi:MAG: hypothetical protein P4L43_19390 [Syntrophobacteraceae bacterium]|nr:hypothetical protein [Syntrophobacteraceae bacterium]
MRDGVSVPEVESLLKEFTSLPAKVFEVFDWMSREVVGNFPPGMM